MLTAMTAAAIPQRPEPARLVNDLAGLFTHGQTAGLENMLVAFDVPGIPQQAGQTHSFCSEPYFAPQEQKILEFADIST